MISTASSVHQALLEAMGIECKNVLDVKIRSERDGVFHVAIERAITPQELSRAGEILARDLEAAAVRRRQAAPPQAPSGQN